MKTRTVFDAVAWIAAGVAVLGGVVIGWRNIQNQEIGR